MPLADCYKTPFYVWLYQNIEFLSENFGGLIVDYVY